jgi:Uma2 family endonuclease
MAAPAPSEIDEEMIAVPGSVRFPVELTPPEGFDPARLETWPRVEGRLEWVAGRLLYMPPCGTRQQYTVADLVGTLMVWARSERGFVVGTNEAGMLLGEDVRGADAAVWKRAASALPADPGVQRVPPVLAAEVAGREESEAAMREKARWYLDHGVAVVWLLLPALREVVVVTSGGESRHGMGDRLPADPRLPGLAPPVDELFHQISRSG